MARTEEKSLTWTEKSGETPGPTFPVESGFEVFITGEGGMGREVTGK